MTKEHKKLYKAGKNWIAATLTATTITLLGGIGAYTAHADTTAENNQSTEILNISQSSQSDNSSNSVVLTQPVTTQSNQIALSNQSEQSTPTNQATSTATMNITTTNSFNKVTPNNYGAVNENSNPLLTQKYSDNSSLWYHPSVDYHFDNEIAGSGTGGDQTIAVQDPYQPSITTYYSFANFSDNPEISQYAHKTVSRIIYLKNPQTGLESVDGQAQVNFNRWIAIDKDYNNQLVGAGPWITSLVSPTSFPEYNIPQKNGYTSYCNGKKATMIDEEQVSGNQPDEIYHITYVPTSSLVDKKTRTIIIKFPDRKQESTIQNTVLSGNSTCIWPKYVIPARDGYDSYVDGLKASVVPEQTVDVNDDDNVIVNVTYKMSTWGATHKRITRTIYIHDIDGIVSAIPQAVVYTRYAISNMQGNLVSYTNWVADGNSSWNEYAIPQHEGFISQIGSEDTKVVPSQLVNPNDEDTIVNVTYKKTPVTPSKDKHKAITRTIKIAYPSGYVQTISQTVNYTYHTVKIGSEVLAGWIADGNDSWDEYAIPQHDGFISQVDSQDAKIVPSQHVNPNDKDVDVSITYIKTDSSNGNGDDNNNPSRLNTGTINYIDPDGKVVKTDQISGKVGDKVDVKISLPDGYELANKDEQIPSTVTVTEDGISPISVNIKKINTTPTTPVNPTEPNNPTNPAQPSNPTTLPTGQPGWSQQNGNWYYFNNQGSASTGWQKLNGRWYYFDDENANALTGWQKLNGRWYYFDPTNAWAQTGWFKSGAGYWYFFDYSNAWALTDWQRINNNWYYFDPENTWALTGWQNLAGHWYYFDPENAWALTGWQYINGHWYWFDSVNAWALTGWQRINNNWYYFDPENTWALTGWQNLAGHWYYFDPENAWALTGWQYINGHWYWFDSVNAWALTGWQWYNGNWYFMDQQNAWMMTGWATNTTNDQLYYLDQNGHPVTGWQRDSHGFWYYLQPSDAAAIGWNWINGYWYYFNPEETINGIKAKGAMFTGRHFIDNRWNRFDLNGHWLGYEN